MAHENLNKRRYFVKNKIIQWEKTQQPSRCEMIRIAEKFGCSEGAIHQDIKYIKNGGILHDPNILVCQANVTKFKKNLERKCIYCGTIEGKFEVDHIIPKSRGGNDDVENLAIACFKCNRQKSNMFLSEWLG